MSVREAALHAHQDREYTRQQESERRRREREAENARLDAETLEQVAAHPWLVGNFGRVDWVLVDRENVSNGAVIHPPDEPDVLLVVRWGEPNHVWLAQDRRKDGWRQWFAGSDSCATLADLGRAIHDRETPRYEEALDPVPADDILDSAVTR